MTDPFELLGDVSQLPKPQPEDLGQANQPIDPFAQHWKTLADAGISISDPPPNRRWLLRLNGEGALPLGKAGILAAGGGVGKTMALVQLALAVALGDFWLNTFKAVSPGYVLIALGEEDLEEVQRRFYNAANALGLDRQQRAEAAKRIVALPLAGTPIAITEKDKQGNTTTTSHLETLRKHLDSFEHDWSLVILDPLSRWAGEGTEIDNAAATRFVQAVETLVNSKGNPTVLVAHHSSKSSIKDGESNVRGSSAIVDGFRWVAALDSVSSAKAKGLRLRLVKTNYTKQWDEDIILIRSTEQDSPGILQRANPAQTEELLAASKLKDELESRDRLARARELNAQANASREKRIAEKNNGNGSTDPRFDSNEDF